MYFHGKLSPICGHYFWDNNNGAALFCQKLDPKFNSGTVIRHTDKQLDSDAVKVGKCQSNDQWFHCTGGCNELETGNGCAKCATGEMASIEIKCHQEGKSLKKKILKNHDFYFIHTGCSIFLGWILNCKVKTLF